tara:strand:- start:399 stop:1364 length:966 start_codon:yes stop_codon:yes gene_type:complete
MRLKFINYPKYTPLDEYDKLTAKIAKQLIDLDEVVSVYRMGSIKNPGISDLDIVCVFKDESKCMLDVRNGLNTVEKNILTHGSFGINEGNIEQSLKFNFLTNLKLLEGKDLNVLKNPDINMDGWVKHQIALEFLLKMYITLDIQIAYGIIKLRSFLLQGKALIFDLELLNIHSGELYDIVNQIIKMRNNWFELAPSIQELDTMVRTFHKSLGELLKNQFAKEKFQLPSSFISVTRNISIQKNPSFYKKQIGFTLPPQFSFLGKKYVNVQNRFNKFIYKVNFNLPSSNSEQDQRFLFYKNLVEINRRDMPNFIPLTTSLSLY